MARNAISSRPKPKFEDGYFVPATPVPNQRKTEDYRWYHSISAIPAIADNPLASFNAEQYENPITQFRFMFNDFSVVNDPDMIRYCFVENRNNYRFSAIRQRVARAVIGDGLVSAEGKKWSNARRLMSPMFSPLNVKRFAEVMKTTTEREMPNILEHDSPIKIDQPMAALTYLVLSDTLFSGEIDREQKEVLQHVSTALTYVGRPDPLDLVNAPEWLPRLSHLRGMEAVKHLREMIGELTQARKTRRDNNEELPDDLLSRLLLANDAEAGFFGDEDIENHVLAFVVAGHETTARALSWLFYLLSNDTQSRDRLEAEVDSLDTENVSPEKWGEQMPFSLACFEETMRLFPPAPFIAREAIGEDTFGAVTMKANSILLVNTWLLHRHKTLWEKPDAFDPKRFLGKLRSEVGRFQYLPFGVGERVCIGQRFAMQEAMILVTLLAKRYRFDYVSDEVPWPKLRVSLQPENGMPMRVTRR